MQRIAEDNATDLDTAVLFADTHKTEHAKDDVGHAVVDDHGFPASGNTSLLKVVLECSLPPFTFTVYTHEWKPERNGFVSTIYINKYNKPAYIRQVKVKVKADGSGVCRHSVWTFNMGVDMEVPITVRELGCWGEMNPPENAKGYIETIPWTPIKHFCY